MCKKVTKYFFLKKIIGYTKILFANVIKRILRFYLKKSENQTILNKIIFKIIFLIYFNKSWLK